MSSTPDVNISNGVIASNGRKKKTKLPIILALIVIIIVGVAILIIIQPWKDGHKDASVEVSNTTNSPILDNDQLNKLDAEKEEDVLSARMSAFEYNHTITERLTKDDDYSYGQAVVDYGNKVDSLIGAAKAFYGFNYSQFIYVYGNDLDKAVYVATSLEPVITTDALRIDYLINLYNLYVSSGNTTEADAYDREIRRISNPEDQKGEG